MSRRFAKVLVTVELDDDGGKCDTEAKARDQIFRTLVEFHDRDVHAEVYNPTLKQYAVKG